jgi:hypothetical protein
MFGPPSFLLLLHAATQSERASRGTPRSDNTECRIVTRRKDLVRSASRAKIVAMLNSRFDAVALTASMDVRQVLARTLRCVRANGLSMRITVAVATRRNDERTAT